MADVEVTYKGNSIATMDASGTKILNTSGKYCEDDIEIEYTKSGGVVPTGTINITQNGVVDVTNYASADVNVPTGITPTGTKQISITQNGTTTENVTQYANAEVVVNVPITGQAITGTFTGDGTATVNLQTGFEPDVITITSNTSPVEAGFQGLILVCVAKGVVSLNFYHNSDSDVNERQYAYAYRPNSDPWFNDAGAYRNCASYSNGVLTVTNRTTNNANVYFANGVEYTWAAYKYNS